MTLKESGVNMVQSNVNHVMSQEDVCLFIQRFYYITQWTRPLPRLRRPGFSLQPGAIQFQGHSIFSLPYRATNSVLFDLNCFYIYQNNCTKNNLMENKMNSSSMERMVISTYGSFLADSLADWSRQVDTDIAPSQIRIEWVGARPWVKMYQVAL